jgi:hypothetical protein
MDNSNSKPFEFFKTYRTLRGEYVTVTWVDDTPGYEAVMCDDQIWRYNRPKDRGRVTGSDFTGTHLDNLIPEGANTFKAHFVNESEKDRDFFCPDGLNIPRVILLERDTIVSNSLPIPYACTAYTLDGAYYMRSDDAPYVMAEKPKHLGNQHRTRVAM